MKPITVVWLDGSGHTTFRVREYVDTTYDLYLHEIESVKGAPFELQDRNPGPNGLYAKKARIPMSAVAAVFYE